MNCRWSSLGRGTALFAACAVLIFPRPCAADTSFTETMSFYWHGDNMDGFGFNDDYVDIKNRFNVLFLGKMLEASLRIDTMTILDHDGRTPEAPPGKKFSDDYRLERISGLLKPAPGLQVTLGDTYAQIGNGILLSLRKIDEFGMEKALRGVKVDLSRSIVTLSLMGGVSNTNNVDQQDNYFLEDPMDRIAGAQLGIRPHPRFKVQAQGLFLNWTEKKSGRVFGPMAYGGGLLVWSDLWPGRLTLEAESDLLWREKVSLLDEGDLVRGEATYLKLQGAFGPVSLLLEYKWYEDFQVTGSQFGDGPIAYNQPPTAERYDQEVDALHDVYGGRLKADVKIIEDVILYGNVSAGDYASLTKLAEDKDEKRSAWYLHTYGGLRMFFNAGLSELSFSGGWRREMEPKIVPGEEEPQGWTRHLHIYHVEAKVVFYIAEGWSIRWSLLHESRGKHKATEYVDYDRGTQILGLDLAGVMSLNWAFEYDTEILKLPFDRNLYGWWEGKFYPMENLVVVIKGGLERGGLKCVSGVCKHVPPFTGLGFSLVYRH